MENVVFLQRVQKEPRREKLARKCLATILKGTSVSKDMAAHIGIHVVDLEGPKTHPNMTVRVKARGGKEMMAGIFGFYVDKKTTMIPLGFCTIFDDIWNLAPTKPALGGHGIDKIIRVGRLERNVVVSLKRLSDKLQSHDVGGFGDDDEDRGTTEDDGDLPILQIELGPSAATTRPIPYLYSTTTPLPECVAYYPFGHN